MLPRPKRFAQVCTVGGIVKTLGTGLQTPSRMVVTNRPAVSFKKQHSYELIFKRISLPLRRRQSR